VNVFLSDTEPSQSAGNVMSDWYDGIKPSQRLELQEHVKSVPETLSYCCVHCCHHRNVNLPCGQTGQKIRSFSVSVDHVGIDFPTEANDGSVFPQVRLWVDSERMTCHATHLKRGDEGLGLISRA
jgi:hypothetical protein